MCTYNFFSPEYLSCAKGLTMIVLHSRNEARCRVSYRQGDVVEVFSKSCAASRLLTYKDGSDISQATRSASDVMPTCGDKRLIS